MDTDGRLLTVNVTPADVSDSAGAQTILDAIRKRWPRLKHLFADAGHDRTKLMGVPEAMIHRDCRGFRVLPVMRERRDIPHGSTESAAHCG